MPVCEIYADPTTKKSIDAEATELALAAEAKAAESAGLVGQAQRAKAELEMRRAGFGNPLSDEELKVYQRWYPTTYRVSYLHCECSRAHRIPQDEQDDEQDDEKKSFADYRFDRVPQSVLELITRCRDEFKLDWIEIRTPEKKPQDPGLFGGKGEHAWLFARWSDIGEHLLTFKEIEAGLQARHQIDELSVRSFDLVLNSCALTLLPILISWFSLVKVFNVITGATLSMVVVPIAPVIISFAWLTIRKFKRETKALRKRFAYAF